MFRKLGILGIGMNKLFQAYLCQSRQNAKRLCGLSWCQEGRAYSIFNKYNVCHSTLKIENRQCNITNVYVRL